MIITFLEGPRPLRGALGDVLLPRILIFCSPLSRGRGGLRSSARRPARGSEGARAVLGLSAGFVGPGCIVCGSPLGLFPGGWRLHCLRPSVEGRIVSARPVVLECAAVEVTPAYPDVWSGPLFGYQSTARARPLAARLVRAWDCFLGGAGGLFLLVPACLLRLPMAARRCFMLAVRNGSPNVAL